MALESGTLLLNLGTLFLNLGVCPGDFCHLWAASKTTTRRYCEKKKSAQRVPHMSTSNKGFVLQFASLLPERRRKTLNLFTLHSA